MIMRNGALRRTASTAALIAGCLAAVPVAAQTTPDKTAAKPAETDDAAIVVTARRSEESIQSVPVSVTAFSGATLRENSVSTPEDLQVNTPGVFLSGSGGRQNANFVIRGQSKALSGPSSPAVISYFADVPNPVFGSYTPQFDMASVQVLKGPQGTLFGRNTTGGAVLFTPAAPSADLEGYVQAGYGNYDNRQIEAVINVPLGDKVRVRLGGVRHLRDGYVTNTLDPKRNLDNIDDYSLRGSILVAPVDGVTNTTIVDFYKSDTNGFSSVLVDVIPGNTLLSILGLQGPFRSRLAAQQARGPFVIDQPRSSYERNRRLGITNKTEIEIGALTLTNIFGYRDTAVAYNTDVGTSRVSADGTGAFPAGTPVDLIVASLNNSVHQYSDELQLRGKLFDDKLNWLVGGFYIRSNPSGPQSNLVGFAQIPGFENGRTAYNFITEDSRAVFGHLTYDFDGIDGLQLEAGLRYTKDKIQSCTGVGPSAAGDDVQPGECLSKLSNAAVTKANSSAATWSVGLNWQANDNVFTYLVTRRGYRAGGVNSPNFTGRLVPFQVFSPETVTDIEAGIRTDFEAGGVKFRFNASAFVGWYKNVQTALTGVQTAGAACTPGINNPAPISPDGDCDPNNDPAGGTLLVNLGTSRVSGIDLDGLIRLSDGLSFNYGASFLRPVTTSFTAPPAIAAFVANNTIPFNFATRTTVTAGVRYKLPLPESVGEIVFNADYYWSDKLPFSGTFSPSYDLVNARLDWNGIAGGPIDVSVFSRNLFNKEYQSTGAAAGAFLGFTTAIYAPPRTFGVELHYHFGQ